jgi:hypothetical protein
VPDTDDSHDELLRKFKDAISGMELADLSQLAEDLMTRGRRQAQPPTRPELRRPKLDELKILRVRADLDDARPPIWRRLDLRSDRTLDVVHQVLQAAFGWTDTHLHRFALGGSPFDSRSQWFLCPFDVEEGEGDGVPAADVRLDETLQEPGDSLRYVYDYGDSWELTIRLEDVRPAAADAPTAVAVDGRRAAPPEDCGGVVDAASLAEVVDDPAHFDLDEVNAALRDPYFLLGEANVDQRLANLVLRLGFSPVGPDLTARMSVLVSAPMRPDTEDLVAALRAYEWFLDRAAGDGIELTSAGYLKPADVEAASRVVPTMADWIGKNNRESLTAPLLDFRESLQSLKLLRKYKGRLVLTRAAASVRGDPGRLWDFLAEKLLDSQPGFDTDATLLLLAYAGSTEGGDMPFDTIATSLAELDWVKGDGQPPSVLDLYWLPAYRTLLNVGDRPAQYGAGRRISPAAAALARAALRR